MLTLRLIDPNGYSVPDGVRTITPDLEAQARTELKTLAAQHAAQWAEFGYHPGDHQILTYSAGQTHAEAVQTRDEAVQAAAVAVRAYQADPTTERFEAMTSAIDAAEALGASETDLIAAALNR